MKPQPVFVVAYPCPRACIVELDEGDLHAQMTFRQMLAMAAHRHGCGDEVRPSRPVQPVFQEPS